MEDIEHPLRQRKIGQRVHGGSDLHRDLDIGHRTSGWFAYRYIEN
jgi:phage anti-repressor protein